jgi:hydrogenase-4 component E
MEQFLDPMLILALALNFVALGVSRIRAVINAVAFQGIVLGLLPLLVHAERDHGILETAAILGLRGFLLMAATIALKGFIIPSLLFRAMREANIQHEVRPVINYMSSLLLGALGTGLALVFSGTLPLADTHSTYLLVPASLATVWTGFLLLTTRKKAIMQVLGYLLLENGIFLFGLLLLEADQAFAFLVEAGILLDLFTGVFVMGIIIHHINREFASISTEH